MKNHQYVTVRQVADLYGISLSSAYAFVHDLPVGMVVKIGRLYRVDREKLEAYVSSGL